MFILIVIPFLNFFHSNSVLNLDLLNTFSFLKRFFSAVVYVFIFSKFFTVHE